MSITTSLFWTCALALIYLYAGYPALIRLWAALRSRPARSDGHEPEVSLLIAARNEAPRMADRIRNLLSLDYDPGRIEILIGSDGSDDGTAEAAAAL